MAYNKVVIRNGEEEQVVLDVSDTTVTAADLQKGKTAVDKTGAKITGVYPKIHSEDGTLELTDATGTANYSVRDDMVSIFGTDIVVGSSGLPYVVLPSNLYPGRAVLAHALSKDSEGYFYTNKAYAEIRYGTFYIRGVSEGDTVSFNMSYILEE